MRTLDEVPTELPSIREIVADDALRLRLVAGGSAAARTIRSVHVTDLAAPGRYLLPGELVLTNGLWVGATDASAWVGELVRAGSAGVGFGLGTPHAAVPEELRRACEEGSVPLFEVPEDVSFAAVSDAVAERTAHAAPLTLRRHLQRARTLVSALPPESLDAPLELLRRETGLACAFVGPGGRTLASAGGHPSAAAARAAAAGAVAGRLPATVAPGASAFPAAASTPPWTTLLVRAALADIEDEHRVVVEQVASHAALADARRETAREVRAALADELLALVRDDALAAAPYAARLRSLSFDPAAPIVPVAIGEEAASVRYALAAGSVEAVVCRHDGVAVALLPAGDDSDPAAEVARALEEAGLAAAVAAGRPAEDPGGVRRSLVEALHALAHARGGGTSARGAAFSSHAALLELVEPAVLEQFRDAVLGPVLRWDAEHGTELLRTLRVFLASGGRWRETASLLHVHHNTLRHRLKRVEALSGRHLSATADRVDFQLALASLDERPAPNGLDWTNTH